MSSNTAQPVPDRNEPVEAAGQQATDQPANNVNPQESGESGEKRKHEQPDLNMNYSTREQLINTLSRLSAVLRSGQPIPLDVQQRTCQNIGNAIISVISPTASDVTANSENRILNQITFQVSGAEQAGIIKQLIANQNAMLDEQATEETKQKLAADNGALVLQLLDLKQEDRSELSKRQRGR